MKKYLELVQNSAGFRLPVDFECGSNISDVTALELVIKKPDDTRVVKTLTLADRSPEGEWSWEVAAGDLSQVGFYRYQFTDVTPGRTVGYPEYGFFVRDRL